MIKINFFILGMLFSDLIFGHCNALTHGNLNIKLSPGAIQIITKPDTAQTDPPVQMCETVFFHWEITLMHLSLFHYQSSSFSGLHIEHL